MSDTDADIAYLNAVHTLESDVIDAAMAMTAHALTPLSLAFRTALLDLMAACKRLREMEAKG